MIKISNPLIEHSSPSFSCPLSGQADDQQFCPVLSSKLAIIKHNTQHATKTDLREKLYYNQNETKKSLEFVSLKITCSVGSKDTINSSYQGLISSCLQLVNTINVGEYNTPQWKK